MTQRNVEQKCVLIIDEFDRWLALRVLQHELKHEDLPQLNDMFRDYFADTRSALASGGSS